MSSKTTATSQISHRQYLSGGPQTRPLKYDTIRAKTCSSGHGGTPTNTSGGGVLATTAERTNLRENPRGNPRNDQGAHTPTTVRGRADGRGLDESTPRRVHGKQGVEARNHRRCPERNREGS
eukprot:scaffold204191_cov26-Tisochrysis_lutea.AAC.1